MRDTADRDDAKDRSLEVAAASSGGELVTRHVGALFQACMSTFEKLGDAVMQKWFNQWSDDMCVPLLNVQSITPIASVVRHLIEFLICYLNKTTATGGITCLQSGI